MYVFIVWEMSDPLNTHTYDGKINIGELPDISTVKQLPIEQKKQRGNELLFAASNGVHRLHPTATHNLNQIISQMGTPSNIDMTNGLIADDLICICWIYRENKEFMSALETQLIDMSTGFCPQGRTHRLFQILLAFI